MKNCLLALSILLFLGNVPRSFAQEKANLRAIARDAYIYGYPLVAADAAQRAFLSAPGVTEVNKVPLNQFIHIKEFLTPAYTAIENANADTLYSNASLDLTKEPVILTVPLMGDRYFLFPLIDAWTNVFASVGTRTTGSEKGAFAIVGPNWKGSLPSGVKEIRSPTNSVWIIGRIHTKGPDDYENVLRLQKEFRLIPLSAWGRNNTLPSTVYYDPSKDTRPSAVAQVDTMDAVTFFTRMSELLKTTAIPERDLPVVKKFAAIGIIPGKDFDPKRFSPAEIRELNQGVDDARKLIETTWSTQSYARRANGWTIAVDKMGDYGTDYLVRAAVAYGGLGTSLSKDTVYPATNIDNQGRQLNGAHRYVIHFTRDQLPPADAFWTITVYNSKHFLTANPFKKYSIGDRDPLKFNRDGSLDLYIQRDSPGKDKETNWLPVPAEDFNLMMRIYDPRKEVLNNTWSPPAVTRVD